MSDPRYKDGDVVWCKCGGLFWPGEVKGLSSLPEEIREGFLRTPLVVVKFFDEDGYEFVLNENNIFPYNCNKKTDFIQKGIARYRSKTKEGATDGWYAKFPKDVIHCEKMTNGNPDILEEPPFAERKEPKVDYNKIFADPATEPKKQKNKTPSKVDNKKENKSPHLLNKSKKKSEEMKRTPKITHRRFLKGGSDHEVRILTQPSSPFHFTSDLAGQVKDQASPLFRCPMCDFSATRVNVVVMHSKSHSKSKASYAPTSEATPKRVTNEFSSGAKSKEAKSVTKKVEKKLDLNGQTAEKKKATETPNSTKKKKCFAADSSVGSGKKRPATAPKAEKKPSTGSVKKPRLSKKEKEEKQRRKEEKHQLLMEWSEDEDGEAEEFKKIQESINQSLRTESSDDEVDDVFKRDEHHYSMDSDEEPFRQRTSEHDRSGSRISTFTPESAKSAEKWSPLPNHESQSRSLQPSPFSGISASRSCQPSPSTASPVQPTPGSPAKGSPSPFSKLVASSTDNKKVESAPNNKATKDLFDIDKALEENRAPEIPSLTFTKFSDFSAFKKKQKLLSKTMSPNKEDENQNTADSVTDSQEIDDFDFDNNDDELFLSPLKRFKRTVSPKPPPPKSDQVSESPSKFSSLSAKAKAKQLARQAALLKNKSEGANSDSSPAQGPAQQRIANPGEGDKAAESQQQPADRISATSLTSTSPSKMATSPVKRVGSPVKSAVNQSVNSNRNGTLSNNVIKETDDVRSSPSASDSPVSAAVTPISTAALVVTTLCQLSPAPVMGITQLSSPSTIAAISAVGTGSGTVSTPGGGGESGGELEGAGEEQIYYMLVDDGAQLDNQTILIDEAQLAAAGSQAGNVIIQGDGELLMEGGARTVLLQDANGQLVVVADEKDLRSNVSHADTSGGVATLPNHPSSSMHSQVPLITTPSGKTPIMISANPGEESK